MVARATGIGCCVRGASLLKSDGVRAHMGVCASSSIHFPDMGLRGVFLYIHYRYYCSKVQLSSAPLFVVPSQESQNRGESNKFR